MRRFLGACAFALATIAGAAHAQQEDAAGRDPPDLVTPRYEPAGFPFIAGSSDIGVQFGLAGTLTRFAYGQRPYVWNIDTVLSVSVKDGPHGLELGEENYYLQWDRVGLFDGKVRTMPAAYYAKFLTAGWFGRGNDSSPEPPKEVNGDRARYFKYISRELRIRDFTRIRIRTYEEERQVVPSKLDLMIAPILRFNDPEAYPGSKLEEDSRATDKRLPLIRGFRRAWIASLATGFVWDSRNDEIFPTRGFYHQMGTRYAQGFPLDGDINYTAWGAIFCGYRAIGNSPFVFAGRLVLDTLFGHVPFYDLYNAGPFNNWEMPGGREGVRGVPVGRYAGPAKVVANAEVRALLSRFQIFGQKLRVGGDVFFDTGRVWDDYKFNNPRDGSGVGLHWGTGTGIFLMWGDAAVFRWEIAYSPDARAVSPDLPLGMYVADSVMF